MYRPDLTERRVDKSWMDEATCQNDPVLFTGRQSPEQRHRAVFVCRHICPVLAECNTWAQRHYWHDVVVGGNAYGPGTTVKGRPMPKLTRRARAEQDAPAGR